MCTGKDGSFPSPPVLRIFSARKPDQVWNLENMLKYLKEELVVEEYYASLVDEKLRNRCNENIVMPSFFYLVKNL